MYSVNEQTLTDISQYVWLLSMLGNKFTLWNVDMVILSAVELLRSNLSALNIIRRAVQKIYVIFLTYVEIVKVKKLRAESVPRQLLLTVPLPEGNGQQLTLHLSRICFLVYTSVVCFTLTCRSIITVIGREEE